MTRIIKKALTYLKCKASGISYRGGWIHPSAEIKKYKNGNVVLESDTILHKGVRIDVAGEIILGKGTSLNTYTRVESGYKVKFGENVLVGPNVYISDRSHQYQNVNMPIMKQGYYEKGSLEIGSGTWIGIHACVLGNVKIGKGCVIGANAVVTKDIPDYCVVVGNPGRVIKKYDFTLGKWINALDS